MAKKLILLWLAWIIVFAVTVLTHNFITISKNKTLINTLATGIAQCTDHTTRNRCILAQARSDLKNYSFEDILTGLETIQSKNLPFQYHDYLHFLAMEQYYKKKDLAKLFVDCTPVFYNACYHGVVIGALNQQKINPTDSKFADFMVGICDTFNQPREKGYLEQCIHGVGHALMIVMDYELPDALTLCDNFPEQRPTCYGGVYMENFPQSSSSDIPTKYLPTNDPLYPCNSLAEIYQEQCYIFLSIYHNHIGPHDWSKTEDFCQKTPEYIQDECIATIGNSVIATPDNISTLKDICNTVSAGRFRVYCYLGIVGSFDDKYGGNDEMISRISDFCLSLDSQYQPYCVNRSGNVFEKWLSDAKWEQLCLKFDTKYYQDLCLKKIDLKK